jgi:nucleotide-binding universal stress UspA family protein
MLDPETQITSTDIDRRPRALVVVDGSERAWRALAWALGYARSRHIPVLDLVTRPGPWQHVPDAGQVCALMATEFPRVDREAIHRSLIDSAREFCAGGGSAVGVDVRVTGRRCDSSRELLKLVRRDRPDLVVLSGTGSLFGIGRRRTAARLMRRGVPVVVIP